MGSDKFYEPNELQRLKEEYYKVSVEYNELLHKCMQLQFKNPDTEEYAKQGFMRRLGTLKRCIHNVYMICPPDKLNKPTIDALYDIGINLQSFVFNVFGSVDNLAWIWVKETNFNYKRNTEVTFSNKKLRNALTVDFKTYLDELDKWFKYLEEFRHALAHRIPLYVPPFRVTPEEGKKYAELEQQQIEAIKQYQFEKLNLLKTEQAQLGNFIPCMTHSYNEKAPFVGFHAQVLSDWKTVVAIFEMLLKELKLA